MATSPRLARFSGKRVRLSIDSGASAKEIEAALERIYTLSGCDGCGRNGYDIVIGHGDPLLNDFKVPRVIGVNLEDAKTQLG